MTTATLFDPGLDHPAVSFELYPPRTPKGEESVRRTVAALGAVRPDFFSVTYGASGSTRQTSRELLCRILADTDVTPLAHLTCVGASATDLDEYVGGLLDAGIRDFLALRGDPPAGDPTWTPHPQGLRRAGDLVRLLRRVTADHLGDAAGQVSIAVAAYPGGQYDGAGRPLVDPDDVQALLEKQEAGADFAITQVFYDAASYAAFVDASRAAGVHVPVVPGIIPLTDPRRLRRLVELTGVPVPQRLLDLLDGAGDEDEAYRRGMRESVRLVSEVLDAGAPGVHLYTFNTSRAALDLLDGAGLRRPVAPSLP